MCWASLIEIGCHDVVVNYYFSCLKYFNSRMPCYLCFNLIKVRYFLIVVILVE